MKCKKSDLIIRIAQASIAIFDARYTVVLTYDPAKDIGVPEVVAKGQKKKRDRILSLSNRAGIPTVRDGELSSRLYHKVKVGKQIPEKMFSRVAEILSDNMGGAAKQQAMAFLAGKGRKPHIKMEQLILPATVEKALSLALNQYRCRDVLEQWELEKNFPYGMALILMFSGPPGVGKTAAAEAVAHELGKDILVVDYSQMESKWLGETEKNIVAAFEQASCNDCVLFWDEADSMLYDRETEGCRSWEIRSVNVLLQELEKFKGVCILSTNRKTALDKALARRVSLKIDFQLPAPNLIRKLWTKMLPPKMPLADDVDFDKLAKVSLTGGEIKNVILNAARSAAGRGIDSTVAMDDFEKALELETAERDWVGADWRKIGFQPNR